MLINLVPSVSPDALPEEPEIAAGLGLDYVHIPVLWDSPTRQDLIRFFETLDANSNRKVFAHCVLNMRVSAFVFLYNVIRKGVPEEIAKQAMLEIWEALFEMCALVRKMGTALAEDLGYEYPLEDDRRTIAYLRQARSLPKNASSFDGN